MDAPPEPRTGHPRLRLLIRISLALVAVGLLLAAVGYYIGFRETLDALRRAGPPAFLLLGVMNLLPIFFAALAWFLLARRTDAVVPLKTLVRATTVGMAVNILTPSAYLGGEAGKVIYAGRATGKPVADLAGPMIVAKSLEGTAFAIVFAMSAAVTAAAFGGTLFEGKSRLAGFVLLGVAAVLCVGCLSICFCLARGWPVLSRLARLLRRLRPRSERFARLVEGTRALESRMARVFKENRRAVLGSLLVCGISMMSVLVRPLVFFGIGFGAGLSFPDLALLFLAGQGLLAFQLTPGGVGIFDGGMYGALTLMGVGGPEGVAYLLCFRFWDAAVAVLGLVISVRAGVSFFRSGSREAGDDAAAPKTTES